MSNRHTVRSRAIAFTGLLALVLVVTAFSSPRFSASLSPRLSAAPASRVTTTPSSPDVAELRRHTRLVRSEPAKDSVIRVAPTELRLWFSETLDLAVTRVRLVDGQRAPVHTAALTRADAADAPIVAALEAPLPNGNYSVEWSTSSKDGHPVRGTFRFSVRVAP